MSERGGFDDEHADHLDQGIESQRDSIEFHLEVSARVTHRRLDSGDLVAERLKSRLEPIDRIIGSLRRHRAEANRSGSDAQCADDQ
jgi:hypothetical protein